MRNRITKNYLGPYYVVGDSINEVFTYQKDVSKRFKVTGSYKEIQNKLSKRGLILTREKNETR